MIMTLAGLIAWVLANNEIQPVINNPLSQFGPPNKPMLGATLLPLVRKTANDYREGTVKIRAFPANHSTRYSPIQLKGGAEAVEMLVSLGNSDIGSELTSQDYDAVMRYLDATDEAGIPPMEAVAILTRWMDVTIISPLDQRNEIDRWKAIIDGVVAVRGDNNYNGDFPVIASPGHRVVVAGDWNDPDYDIYGEIQEAVTFMSDAGKEVIGMIAGKSVVTKMRQNNSFKELQGSFSVQGASIVGQRRGYIDKETLDNQFRKDSLPPITEYNTTYDIDGGSSKHFFRRDALVMIASTGRTEQIDIPDAEPLLLEDTLGYVGDGIGAGQNTSGKVGKMFPKEDKPPRLEFQGWQSTGVVITDPDAIFAFTGIGM